MKRGHHRPPSAAPQRPHAPAATREREVARLLAAGVTKHREGALAKADTFYRRVLVLDPRQPDALHLSGLVAHQGGDQARALELIDAALAVTGGSAVYRNSRGVVLLSQERAAEAEAEFRRVLAADPVYAEALNNLGNALERQGRHDEAVAAYDQALEVHPGYVEAWCNRGRTRHLAGDVTGAVRDLRHTVELRPSWVKARRYLGEAEAAAGDRHRAEACYREALGIDPADAQTHASLASLLERENLTEAALAEAEAALAVEPELARAAVVAAKALRRLGRPREALARLDACEGLPGVSAEDRSAAAFERGQILDREGEYAAAYRAFVEANRLLGATPAALATDRTHFPSLISKLRARFDREWVRGWSEPPGGTGGTGDGAAPVFLIGFPRSGTTLLDQILDAHPALSTMEEKDALDRVRTALDARPEGDPARSDPTRDYRAGGYPDALADLSADALEDLRSLYFREAARHVGDLGGRILVDKMPLNIVDAGLIHRLFPRARILLALRHPCDVVLSGFMQAMQPNAGMVLLDSLESAAGFYADVMALWDQYRSVLPLNVLPIRYEDLVDDLPGEARRMLEFLRVPWDERVLDYARHARTRSIATPSYHQVVQPIYRGAVGRWRNYLFAFEGLLPVLAPAASDFGYTLEVAGA